MKTKEVKIRTGKDEEGKAKVVATIVVPVYENVDELIAAEKTETILDYFNSQNATNLQNAERIKHKPGVASKAAKRKALLNLCSTEEVMEALDGAEDKAQAIDDLIESEVIQARYAAIEAVGMTELVAESVEQAEQKKARLEEQLSRAVFPARRAALQESLKQANLELQKAQRVVATAQVEQMMA